MGVKNIQNIISKRLLDSCGSRRGCMRNYWHKLLYFTRYYQVYRQVDWSTVERLVFVCKGNICRSAFAEAVARSEGINTVSCGIEAIEAAPANENAIKIAGQLGFSLDGHRTTPVASLAFTKNDLFVAMEPYQADYLKSHYHGAIQCTLLGLWGTPARPYVHDPYGATAEYFENCFDYIKKSVNEITRKIKT